MKLGGETHKENLITLRVIHQGHILDIFNSELFHWARLLEL